MSELIEGGAEALPTLLEVAYRQVLSLAKSVNTIDIRPFESCDVAKIQLDLGPQVVSRVHEALSLTRRFVEVCDAITTKTTTSDTDDNWFEEDRIDGSYDSKLDELVETLEAPTSFNKGVTDVGNVAFMASSQLSEQSKRLASLKGTHPWYFIAEYDSTLRRVRKSLAAVESVTATALSMEPQLSFQTELQVSLQVRKAYKDLRAKMLNWEWPTEETIYKRLRSAGTELVVFRSQSLYSLLRIQDRSQLIKLQTRLLDWMRETRDNASLGMRIWQDLAGVLELFAQVSHRQELVEHDTMLVCRMSKSLQEGTGPISEDILTEAIHLEGLDPELDSLLASGKRESRAWWSEVLGRLMTHFGKGEVTNVGADIGF